MPTLVEYVLIEHHSNIKLRAASGDIESYFANALYQVYEDNRATKGK